MSKSPLAVNSMSLNGPHRNLAPDSSFLSNLFTAVNCLSNLEINSSTKEFDAYLLPFL